MRGRSLQLNASALIVTNRQGLSLSLFVPLDHLLDNFGSEPGLLLDWLLGLPALDVSLGSQRKKLLPLRRAKTAQPELLQAAKLHLKVAEKERSRPRLGGDRIHLGEQVGEHLHSGFRQTIRG